MREPLLPGCGPIEAGPDDASKAGLFSAIERYRETPGILPSLLVRAWRKQGELDCFASCLSLCSPSCCWLEDDGGVQINWLPDAMMFNLRIIIHEIKAQRIFVTFDLCQQTMAQQHPLPVVYKTFKH